jgi:hypothetical protein
MISSVTNAQSYPSSDDDYRIRYEVFYTLLEIKWKFVSTAQYSGEEMKSKLQDLLYTQFSEYESFRTMPLKDESERRTHFSEIMWDFSGFLNKFYKEYPEKNEIVFRDGSVIQAPEGTNKATYAVIKMMAKMADDKTEWEQWVYGNGQDSFRETWRRLRGEEPEIFRTYKLNNAFHYQNVIDTGRPPPEAFITHPPYTEIDSESQTKKKYTVVSTFLSHVSDIGDKIRFDGQKFIGEFKPTWRVLVWQARRR